MSPGGPLPPLPPSHLPRPRPSLADRFIHSRDVTAPVSVHSEDEGEGPQTHEVQDDEVSLVKDSRAVEFDTFVLHQLFL